MQQGTKSTHKSSITLLYIRNELTEKEIRGKIPFAIGGKVKYLGINPVKEMKDFCN